MLAIPLHLLEGFQRGNAALFLGADIPREVSGVPSRHELAVGLARRYHLPETLSLAQVVQLAGNLQDSIDFVEREITTAFEPSPFHRLVAALPVRDIVTTAYDDLLEQAFRDAHRPYNRVVAGSDIPFLKADRTTLIWLYGRVGQPPTLTLTEDDHYRLLADKANLIDLIQPILATRPVLFLGYDLHDPDFNILHRDVIQRLGQLAVRAVAVQPGLSDAERRVWLSREIEIVDAEPMAFLRELDAETRGQRGQRGQGDQREQIAVPVPQPPALVRDYVGFSLQVGPRQADGTYLLQADGPAGQATAGLTLDPAAGPWPAASTRLVAGTGDLDFLKDLAGQLRAALFPPPIESLFQHSLGSLAEGQGLRIRLRIDPPELQPLPWEFVGTGQADGFFALSPRTPVVRFLAAPVAGGPLKIKPPLRVLAAAASPGDQPPVDAEAEIEQVRQALQPLTDQGKVALEVLAHATPDLLLARLRRPIHVLHFSGHGVFEPGPGPVGDRPEHFSGTGALVLEDAHGESRLLDADELSILLGATSVRFLFLAACQTAQTGTLPSSRGVAQALVKAGIPAALGMQAVIAADSAAAFARGFYAALADGWPVDACTVEGRQAVMLAAGLGRPDWGVPVLIMRSPDGIIFTT
jgi:hypothetical protein